MAFLCFHGCSNAVSPKTLWTCQRVWNRAYWLTLFMWIFVCLNRIYGLKLKLWSAEGNLPAAAAPFPSGETAEGHLRCVFHRMGLTDQDIVALSGAHTLGRAHSTRCLSLLFTFSKECTMLETLCASQCHGGHHSHLIMNLTPLWSLFPCLEGAWVYRSKEPPGIFTLPDWSACCKTAGGCWNNVSPTRMIGQCRSHFVEIALSISIGS